MNVKKAPLIISLLFLSVGFSQQLKTNEVVTERHDNGLKKLLLVFEGTGINEALVGKYGFYEDGLNEFIELYRNNKKHGKSLYWHDNGNQKGELNYKDGKLYGRGSCDMKGFIACTLAYAPIFSKSNLDRDIHFSFTFDEETACIGAPILIKELKKRGFNKGICIVGEPTNMKIIDAHKGAYEYTTYFEGLAGHSSQPHKGVSAVEYAARYVNKLIELRKKLKDRAPKNSIFDPPYSTLSVGGIFGGIAHNVISDKCHVKWETRPVVKDDAIFLNSEIDKYVNENLLPDMKKIFPDSKISKEIIGEIIGFNRDKKSEACEFVSSITGDNSREVVSFGTEAGLFQEIGISAAVCGPGSIEQAHKIDEFIQLEEINKCLNFLSGVKDKSIFK